MKHTNGPWRVSVKGDKFFGIESNDGNICILAAEHKDRINKEANARLIAAAPDLLEALQEIFGMITRGELVRDISNDASPNFALMMLEFVPKLNKATMAIFKAIGE